MNEHLSASDIERYRKGIGAPADLLALDDHLATCDVCRASVADLAQNRELLSSLRTDVVQAGVTDSDHLEYGALAGYAEETLDDVESEIIESHLAVCAACRLEAEDLRAFKQLVSPGLAQEFSPAVEKPRYVGAGARILEFIRPSTSTRSPAWAIAAALVAAIGLVWIVFFFVTKNAPKLAQVPAASPSVPENSQPVTTPTPATPEPGKEILALNDGGARVTLDADGNLAGIESLSPAQAEAVRTALRTEHAVDPSALAGIGGRNVTLRSNDQLVNAFEVLSPVGVVVESARPALRWKPLAGATSYRVAVYDSNYNVVASSHELTATSWTLSQELPRGKIYSWNVTALKDSEEIKAPKPPAPEVKFKVLDGQQTIEIARALRARPPSHVALGVLYARAGLLNKAEREFAALVHANPNSEVARKLLNNVRAAKKAAVSS